MWRTLNRNMTALFPSVSKVEFLKCFDQQKTQWNKDWIVHFVYIYLQSILFQKIISIMYVISYFPTPPLRQDMTQGQFFKQSLTGLNSEFSFS